MYHGSGLGPTFARLDRSIRLSRSPPLDRSPDERTISSFAASIMIRKRPIFALAALASVILLAGCDVFSPQPPEATWTKVELDERVTDAYTDFGFSLFRQLRADDPDGNVFISPSSAAFALAMTYNGAVGQTAEEMARALGVDHLDRVVVNETNRRWLEALRDTGDPEVELALANSIWTRVGFPFLESFREVNRSYYDAEVRELDFSAPTAPDIINGWVRDNTKGLIDEIIEGGIPGDVVAYLINALYFKGDWTSQFDPDDTRDHPFRRPDGSEVTVPMMWQEGDFATRHDEDAVLLRLPYGSGRFSMVLALPHHGSSLEQLAERLDAERWSRWMAGLESPSQIHVGLPRFEMEWQSPLNEALQAMGMEIPFAAGAADFSDMSPAGRDLFIGDVLQKTFLRVDEEGTEAAAVTSVEIRVVSAPPAIVFDRPFLLAIYDHATETVLFLGQITDPS